jgi:hypothetical protein
LAFPLGAGNVPAGTAGKLAGAAAVALAGWGGRNLLSTRTSAPLQAASAHQLDMTFRQGLYGALLDSEAFAKGREMAEGFPDLPGYRGLNQMCCKSYCAVSLFGDGLPMADLASCKQSLQAQQALFKAREAAAAQELERQSLDLDHMYRGAHPIGDAWDLEAGLATQTLAVAMTERVHAFYDAAQLALTFIPEWTDPRQVHGNGVTLARLLYPYQAGLHREHTHNQVGRKIGEISLMLAREKIDRLALQHGACPDPALEDEIGTLRRVEWALVHDLAQADLRSEGLTRALEDLRNLEEAFRPRPAVSGRQEIPDAGRSGRFPDEDPREPRMAISDSM